MTAQRAWLPSYGTRTGVPAPERPLPVWSKAKPPAWQPDAPGAWWWLGVGPHPPVDVVRELAGGGLDAHGGWPAPVEQHVHNSVVLVCWGTVRALEAAREAVGQHAVGQVPQYVALLGLVVMHMPGRTPRPVRELVQSLRGGVPNLWQLPWCEQWTVEPFEQTLTHPPEVDEVTAELKWAAEAGPDNGPTLSRKDTR